MDVTKGNTEIEKERKRERERKKALKIERMLKIERAPKRKRGYLLYTSLQDINLFPHLVNISCQLLIVLCQFLKVVCALGGLLQIVQMCRLEQSLQLCREETNMLTGVNTVKHGNRERNGIIGGLISFRCTSASQFRMLVHDSSYSVEVLQSV
jgi:hypothetical protein